MGTAGTIIKKSQNYTIIAQILNDFTYGNHISYLGTPHKMCDTHSPI